ncbi:hypothetical protein M885DRAFT_590062 [Pelagophyceae sp. CCMP2097]|nr:hypothetical protein M885DRAFT_590062 [Pelagophyceae sp. CCMP2097]
MAYSPREVAEATEAAVTTEAAVVAAPTAAVVAVPMAAAVVAVPTADDSDSDSDASAKARKSRADSDKKRAANEANAAARQLVKEAKRASALSAPAWLRVDLVTTTSARLTWSRSHSAYSLDGVRIGARIKGESVFKTFVTHTHEAETFSHVVVQLESDSEYQFQVVAVHDYFGPDQLFKVPKPMIVDGTRVTSEYVLTQKAEYVKAWFFEDPEDCRRTWAVHVGELTAKGFVKPLYLNNVAAQEMLISQTLPQRRPVSCVTGRRCLQLRMPGGLDGGCTVGTAARDGRRYKVECFIYHEPLEDSALEPVSEEDAGEMEAGTALLKEGLGARLVAWDNSGIFTESDEACAAHCWEKLSVEIKGNAGGRCTLGIQAAKGFRGEILVDAVRVFLLGLDDVGAAAVELENAATEQRINRRGVVHVQVLEAVNLPRKAGGRPATVLHETRVDPDGKPDKKKAYDGEDDGDDPSTADRQAAGRQSNAGGRRLSTMSISGNERPSAPRVEVKWCGSRVAMTAAFEAAPGSFQDSARPRWIADDSSCLTLHLRAGASREGVLEVEVQDCAVSGVAAKAARRRFDSKGKRTALRATPGSPGAVVVIAPVFKDAGIVARRESSVFGLDIPAGGKGVKGMASERRAAFEVQKQQQLTAETNATGAKAVDDMAILRYEKQQLKKPLLEQAAAAQLGGSKPLSVIHDEDAPEEDMAHRVARMRAHMEPATLGRKRGQQKVPDDLAAPIGVLKLRTRDLLAAPAHRVWYRLEDATGATSSCLALKIRQWDPAPRREPWKRRPPVARKRGSRASRASRATRDSRSSRGSLGTLSDDDVSDASSEADEDELENSIGGILSRLSTHFWLNRADKRRLFRQLLAMLGASSSCRADMWQASGKAGKACPEVCQEKIEATLLLKVKTEMVRQGCLEECAASLSDPDVVDVAATLLVALLTLPKKLGENPDCAQCRSTLQDAARQLGVLDWCEEAIDSYDAAVHACGASYFDGEDGGFDVSAPVDGLTDGEKALAKAIADEGAPTNCHAFFPTAAAVLAAVLGSNRRAIVDACRRRPSLFIVIARGAALKVKSACKCLELLNFSPTFDPGLERVYRRHRSAVPCEPAYWRCATLNGESWNDDLLVLEEMRSACRRARERAKAAGRHRKAVGAVPRRVRVVHYAESKAVNADVSEVEALDGAGGCCFEVEDLDATDFVGVGFGLLVQGALDLAKADANLPHAGLLVKTAEASADKRDLALARRQTLALHRDAKKAQKAAQQRRPTPRTPGTPPARPPTPQERAKRLAAKLAREAAGDKPDAPKLDALDAQPTPDEPPARVSTALAKVRLGQKWRSQKLLRAASSSQKLLLAASYKSKRKVDADVMQIDYDAPPTPARPPPAAATPPPRAGVSFDDDAEANTPQRTRRVSFDEGDDEGAPDHGRRRQPDGDDDDDGDGDGRRRSDGGVAEQKTPDGGVPEYES